MISTSHRFLFVHIPKTAGNAIQSLLGPFADDRVVADKPHQDGVERFELANDTLGTSKHATMADYRRALGKREFERFFRFAVVRNPWDRAVSWYFSPHRGVTEFNRDAFVRFVAECPTLRTYVVAGHRRGRCAGLFGRRPLLADLDGVIRYESLAEDLESVCNRIGVEYAPLPVRNKSQRTHYSEYYDDDLRGIVARRFDEEIAAFGYEFESSEAVISR